LFTELHSTSTVTPKIGAAAGISNAKLEAQSFCEVPPLLPTEQVAAVLVVSPWIFVGFVHAVVPPSL
jgi:hypothetical protein